MKATVVCAGCKETCAIYVSDPRISDYLCPKCYQIFRAALLSLAEQKQASRLN
jgi:hypothetical protein